MYDYYLDDFFWQIENRRYEDALSGELDDTSLFGRINEDCEIDISLLEDEPF